MRVRVLFASLSLVVLLVFACGGKKAPPKEPGISETVSEAGTDDPSGGGDGGPTSAEPAEKSLYQRLGGKEGLSKIVDSFLKAILADTKIKARFAKTKGPKLDKFKQALVDQLCTLTGGTPTECDYKKDMQEVHKGMRIREEEWNAFVADLKLALDEHKVQESAQTDLLALLGPLHDPIVTAKPAGKPKK
jgi:hemoglobin